MKNKILLIASLKYEIAEFYKYKNKNLQLFYTGIGKNNVKCNLAKLPDFLLEYSIIFIGFAGALRSEFRLGDVFEIGEFYNESKQKIKISDGKKIFTSIIPADKNLKNKINEATNFALDLVDMESYYVAEFFKLKKHKNIKFFKAVSDTLDFEISDDFSDKNNFRLARKNLTEYILNFINKG